jgi:hypothetical protein
MLTARSFTARLTALLRPVALVEEVPTILPIESVNWASDHPPATVVSGLIVTRVEEFRPMHGPPSAIIAIADPEWVALWALPPVATR